MKPKRTNPLFANFFRANTLVAAAVISLGASALPSAQAQSISVNFGADRSTSTVSESTKTAGAVLVAGNRWNNTTVNGGGTLANLIDSTGAITAGSVTWTAQNTWQSGSTGATATSENGDLTKGYLDDSGTGWTVNLKSPYLRNDIYIIHSTDQGSPATMSAVSVNGVFYKGNGAGGTVPASGIGDSWSASNFSTADTLVESTNYIKVLNQPGVSLAGFSSSPGRSAIAGVQVVNAYSGTLSYWDIDGATAGAGGATPAGIWNTTTSNWSTSAAGDIATGTWTASNAAVFSAGSSATGAYTVQVAGTVTADAVWAKDGTVTLANGGSGLLTLGGSALVRGDTSLIINAPISATTITTAGSVTLGNSGNTIGLATIGGTTTLSSTQTFGNLTGAGTLALGANALTVGGDNADSTFQGLLTGSGAVSKTGTGRLSIVGNTTGYTGTISSNSGILRIGAGGTSGSISGTVAVNGTVELLRSDTNTQPAAFTGAGALNILGTGVSTQSDYTLSGATTGFTGAVTIDDARLRINPANFDNCSSITVASGGQAWMFAGTHTENYVLNGSGWVEGAGQLGAIRLENSSIVSGAVNVASNSRIVAYGTTGTLSGALTGSAALDLNLSASPGTVNFTGNTSGYTGAMTLNAGTVNIGASGLGGSLTVTTGTANVTGGIATNLTASGSAATVGGTIGGNVVSNTGTTTLNGAVTGNVTVNAGRTNLNGNVTGNATVADGAKLAGEGAVTGTLNLGTSGGSDLHVNAATAGALSAGTVNLTGTNFVYLDVLPSTVGPFTVLSYGTLASGDETNFLVQGSYRGSPEVQHDVANQKFTLELDSQARTWDNTALTGNWNTTDLNWVEGDKLFFNGDDVLFTDTAVGTVNLGSNLQPLSITLSNTVGNNYTFAGGSIIGTTGLTMGGGGNLTLGGTNTYTGSVAVNAGVLTLNSQQGLGQTSGVTVASNARVDLNGQSPGALGTGYGYTFTIAGDGGDGAGGVGALTNTSATATYGNSGVKSLVLSGNAEIGGSAGRFDVGSHAGAATSGTINGAGFTLTKVGTNQMVFRAPASNITYVVNAGTLNFEDFDTASGTNKITVNNTAVMGTYGPRTLPNEVDLNTGSTLSNLGGGTGTWTGTVNVLGNATFSVGGGNIVIDGALTGTGNITRTGGNTLVLQNSGASYSGKIANNAGTLRIESASATGTYAGADAITMAGGTTLQGGTITAQASATVGTATTGITQTGNVTYDAGAGNTLTIASPITGTGSLLKPNNTGALVFNGNVSGVTLVESNGGTQTFNGNLTLASASEFRVGTSIVTNLNCPTLTIPGGFRAWTGTTNIAIGTGTMGLLRLQEGDSQPHTINHTAGALSVTGDVRLGHWGGGTCTYNISGGSLNQPDTVTGPTDEAQANLFIGIDGTGILNISGTGVVNTSSLVVNGRGGATVADTLNLTGGRLNIGKWGIRTPQTGTVNLGGGILGAWANWSSSMPMNLTGNGGNVTVNTLDSVDGVTARTITLSGALSGVGGLTKTGAGTLVLTGGGSAGGTLTSTGGTLHLGTSAWTAATVASSAGGSIQPGTPAAAGTVSIPTLTLDGGSPTFRANFTGGDRFLVTGSNAFTVSSPTVLTVIPGSDLFVSDEIPIIDYDGTIGGASGFAGLSATAGGNPHFSLSLVNDTTNTLVKVVIDALDSITWKGNVNGVWDVNSTSNWETVSDSLTSKFYELDGVKFTDDVGAGATTVTLTGTIKPSSLLVDATVNYTLQGDPITGSTGLTKSNTGSLTLLNNNSNTGAVAITGGTVTVGNGGTAGTLGGSGNITLSAATLELNRSDAQTLDRTVVGSGGTLVKNGSNTLTMNAANNTCDITINNGTLAARGGNWSTSFAANRTITINAPGILDTTTHALNGLGGGSRPNYIVINEDAIWKLNNEQQLPNNAVTMTAGIINGPGDIRGTGTVATVAHATKPSQVNCPVNTGNGAVTFDVADGAVATDLSVTGNIGGGNAIFKTGPGTMVPSGTNTHSGGTGANGGVLSIATIADAGGVGGIGTGYLGIANDGTFQYTGTGAETTARALWIDTGAQVKTIEVVSATGDITFTSTAGNINKPFKKTGDGSLTIADVMNAGTEVTVDGGKLTLGGTNVYTGDTTVNAGGTLVVDGDSIADGGALKINGSGKVEVTEPVDPVIEVVDTLWIDGTQMAAGTYGATGSGATNVDDTHFAGAGVVQVTTGPIGYDSWASGYGLAGGDALRTADPDGDGFTNLQEFLFGTNPTTNTGSLTTTSQAGGILTIRWNERTSGATYLLKESATLANDWTTWGGTTAPEGPASGDYQPMKADITIGAGKNFFRVEGVEN